MMADYTYSPYSAVIDKDSNSLHALRLVWPNITVTYCLFHLCMWLCIKVRDSALKVGSVDEQHKVTLQFRHLACIDNKAEFDATWRALRAEWNQSQPILLRVIEKALFCEDWKHTWPVWVRQTAVIPGTSERSIPDAVIKTLKTNLLSEAAMKWTKYTLLNGVRNRRKDVLAEKVIFGKLARSEERV